jgi:hypothetical protein
LERGAEKIARKNQTEKEGGKRRQREELIQEKWRSIKETNMLKRSKDNMEGKTSRFLLF